MPALFLLALNVLLIIVGALMDIYSAIIVVVPLIAPMTAAYAIDPIHKADVQGRQVVVYRIRLTHKTGRFERHEAWEGGL